MNEKKLYIISGCNGAGKTTASYTILPDLLECKEFVNADEIAKGLSPFQPEKVAMQAGRLMLERIHELIIRGENFAFETTLSTRSYKNLVPKAKEVGYTVTLIFYWLETFELAKERVRIRVSEGGHYIPPDDIERRYIRGVRNLFEIYLPLVHGAFIFDNTKAKSELIASKQIDGEIIVYNEEKYNQMLKCK